MKESPRFLVKPMKNMFCRGTDRGGLSVLLSVMAVLSALIFIGPAAAQNWGDFEYDPEEGLHEEEWYDPSDWFDTDAGISFESNDWWDYGYGYGDPFYDYRYDGYGYHQYYGMGPYFTEDSPYYTDETPGTNGYYTDRWYEDDGVFEGWFE